MSNFLDLRCPACGNTSTIHIEATLWVHVTDDGTTPRTQNHWEYTPKSPAQCEACGYIGRLSSFHPDDEVRS